MKINQIRKLMEKYADVTKTSGNPKKAAAISSLSNALAPVDKKMLAFVLKKLSEAKQTATKVS